MISKKKKLTLPLIYTLNTVSAAKKRELIYIIKNENKQKKYINQVIEEVVKAGGIDYATEKMNQYRDEAITLLHQFPENEIRRGLESLVRFTTDRKY
jgi:octaprenyl-diphosphate synthase